MNCIFCLNRLQFPFSGSHGVALPLRPRHTFIMVSSLLQFLHYHRQQQYIDTDTNIDNHHQWANIPSVMIVDAANKEATTMNSKSSNLTDTRFSGRGGGDCASWNATFTAQYEYRKGEGTLKLFWEMQIAAAKPDRFTLGDISKACSCAASLEEGEQDMGDAGSLSRPCDFTCGCGCTQL